MSKPNNTREKMGYDPDSPYADMPEWAIEQDDENEGKVEEKPQKESTSKGGKRMRGGRPKSTKKDSPPITQPSGMSDNEEEDLPEEISEEDFMNEILGDYSEDTGGPATESGPQFTNMNIEDDSLEYEEYIPEEEIQPAPLPETQESFADTYVGDEIVTDALEEAGLGKRDKKKMTIFVADDLPVFSTEFTVSSIKSVIDPTLEYKNLYISIRAFVNDIYSVTQVKEAAFETFKLLHYLLDAIMLHADKVGTTNDYTKVLDQHFLNTFADINAKRLTKRPNGARVTAGTKYMLFPRDTSPAGFKIWVHEDTNPMEAFNWYMKQLEVMSEVVNIKTYLDNQSNPNQQSVMPQQQIDTRNINNVIVCRGDEDAQNAPPDSTISYYATKLNYSQRQNGVIWQFWMPTINNWRNQDIQGSQGIYMYVSDRNVVLFNEAKNNAVLPPYIENGETMECSVIVIARKLQSAKGFTYYEPESFVRPDPSYSPQ